jgi:hypothetical protein
MVWLRLESDDEEMWPATISPPATATKAAEAVARPERTSLAVRHATRAAEPVMIFDYAIGNDAGAGVARVILTLTDAGGRTVRTLKNQDDASPTGRVTWGGRDAFGAPVAPGVYVAQLRVGSIVRLVRVVIDG